MSATTTMPRARLGEVRRWMVRVTAPVLWPLAGSVLLRHVYYGAAVALLGVGAGAIAALAATNGDYTTAHTIVLHFDRACNEPI